jgi:hypothetical protein
MYLVSLRPNTVGRRFSSLLKLRIYLEREAGYRFDRITWKRMVKTLRGTDVDSIELALKKNERHPWRMLRVRRD